jgi:hypothetical protein
MHRSASARSERIIDMTLLTHPGGPSARPRHASESRDPARIGAGAAYLATAKRLFARALVLLAAGLALAAIMALKVAVYLPRFIHH